jgi:2-octaprenyl-6-methoxyphenol hydroxylase
MPAAAPLRVAVVGAGPVGLAVALLAARRWPAAELTVHDARAPGTDFTRDRRTLALSLGSVQTLERLGAMPRAAASAITEVHVSQAPPSPALPGWPAVVRMRAADLPSALVSAAPPRGALAGAVPHSGALVGAVLPYGVLVAALEAAWLRACAAEPTRLAMRFGAAVSALVPRPEGVDVDAGVAERFDLVVVAEGGVFAQQPRRALRRDYRQAAWVGELWRTGAPAGTAFERFTRDGPLALLPLPPSPEGPAALPPGAGTAGAVRAALVWCVPSGDEADDPVARLTDAQRLVVLAGRLPPEAGTPVAISPLARFELGLNARPNLVEGRVVHVGNAAQTLHPVAGQGLNLGLRDVEVLAETLAPALGDTHARTPADPHAGGLDAALARFERRRRPDRVATIATTDLLAGAFTWPGATAAALRGAGLSALGALPPARAWLARRMMFGLR